MRRSENWGSGMLRWRIRSALYIDFENVPLPPDAIANWLAWLEDGVFDPAGRRRRFLQKRVYWNSHAERNRALFQRHGFAPILIGKYSGLKNGADIRMAMDVVEATYTRSEIDEFILLTGDSDFVPVLERLRQKAKRSAIVATEHRPNIHTTYHRSADLLIPSRRLTEAAQYERENQGLLSRLFAKPQAKSVAAPPAASRAATEGARASTVGPAPTRPIRKDTTDTAGTDPTSILETAAKQVLKLLIRQPRNYVAQKRVVAELEQLQTFKRQGPTAFFGTGSYKNLAKELTRIEPRITVVDQPGGGTGVVFIPPPSEATSETAAPAPAPTRASSTVPPNGSGMRPQRELSGLDPEADPAHLPVSKSEPDVSPAPAPVDLSILRPTEPPPAEHSTLLPAAPAQREAPTQQGA